MAFYGAMKVEYDWTISLNEWAAGGTVPSFKELEGPNVTFGNIFVSGIISWDSPSNKGKFRIAQAWRIVKMTEKIDRI